MTWSATSVALTSLTARTTPVVLSTLRLSAATLLMPFILLASGQAGDLADAKWTTLTGVTVSGLIGYAIGDTVYIQALKRIGMQQTFPITMALFIALTVAGGVVLLDEPFTWGLPAGALLIGLGVYLIVIPGKGQVAQVPAVPVSEGALATFADVPGPATVSGGWSRYSGYAMLLAVGVLWAVATLWLAASKGDLGAIAAGSIRTPAGAAGLLMFAFAVQRPQLAAPFRDRGHILAIVIAGVIGTAFGSLMYVYAVVEAGAARTAVLSATAPLLALPLSIIFLKERLTRRIGAGTALCVAGILLVVA